MAINKSGIPFIGNRGGICGYMTHDLNIIRKSTALNGDRIKQDSSFEGFRKSCSRMQRAAPIASALYRQIPKKQRKFTLYRILTGEVLKMIKAGQSEWVITIKLYRKYIEPLLLEKPPTGTSSRLTRNQTPVSSGPTVNLLLPYEPRKQNSSFSFKPSGFSRKMATLLCV